MNECKRMEDVCCVSLLHLGLQTYLCISMSNSFAHQLEVCAVEPDSNCGNVHLSRCV